MELNAGERKYFSQFGQDKWVVEEIFDFKREGYFVDLAAGDGLRLSNTYFLEKFLDWEGICIEAHKVLWKELIKNRTCICENVCVDGKRHKVKFSDDTSLKYVDQYWKNLCGGIIDKDTDNCNKKNEGFVWKETVTLVDVLKKHNAPKVIHYLSLDIEGAEARVMKDFPFDKYVFLSMSVERPGKSLHRIFKENRYVLVNENQCDKLYVHKCLLDTFTIKKKIKIYFNTLLSRYKSIKNIWL